jgi:hypothetical protein
VPARNITGETFIFAITTSLLNDIIKSRTEMQEKRAVRAERKQAHRSHGERVVHKSNECPRQCAMQKGRLQFHVNVSGRIRNK